MTTIAQQLKAKNQTRRDDRGTSRLVDGFENRRSYYQDRSDNRRGSPSHFDGNINRRENFQSDRNRRPFDDYANPRQYISDGLDHINLWDRGNTELGRVLAMEFANFYDVPVYGRFTSVLALWAYLTTKGHPIQLSRARSEALRHWILERDEQGMTVEFPNVEYICAQAAASFIKRDEAVRNALINTGDADLLAYSDLGHGRRKKPYADMWVSIISLIRSQLQADMPLDMSVFFQGEDGEDPYIPLEQTAALGQIIPVKKQKEAKPKKEKREPRATEQKEVKPKEPQVLEELNNYYLAFATNSQRRDACRRLSRSSKKNVLAFLESAKPGELVNVDPPEDSGIAADAPREFLVDVVVTVTGRVVRTRYMEREELNKTDKAAEAPVAQPAVSGEEKVEVADLAAVQDTSDQELLVDVVEEEIPVDPRGAESDEDLGEPLQVADVVEPELAELPDGSSDELEEQKSDEAPASPEALANLSAHFNGNK